MGILCPCGRRWDGLVGEKGKSQTKWMLLHGQKSKTGYTRVKWVPGLQSYNVQASQSLSNFMLSQSILLSEGKLPVFSLLPPWFLLIFLLYHLHETEKSWRSVPSSFNWPGQLLELDSLPGEELWFCTLQKSLQPTLPTGWAVHVCISMYCTPVSICYGLHTVKSLKKELNPWNFLYGDGVD